MSKFKPTESQQIFIDCYNKNTLVSASAGSGKTSTMINKLTDMVVNRGVPLKNMLVVTYTNSAGSEIKQKLYNSLVEAMQQEQDDEKIDFISSQLDEMSNCDIGTLHSVCKKIITTYFYVVEQDPTFSLLNEQQSTYLLDNAIIKVFNELIENNNDDFYYVYKLFSKKRNLNQLSYVVKTIYNYLLSKVDACEWINYVIEECCCNGSLAEQYLLDYFKKELNNYLDIVKGLKTKCLNHFDYYLDYVSDRLNFILAVNSLGGYEKFVHFVNSYEFVKKPKIYANKLSVDDVEIVEEVDLVMGELNDLVKTIKSNCVIMSQEEWGNYKDLIKKIFNVVDLVDKEYKQVKKNQNSLDFSDLEHIVLEILKDEKIADALKEKYEYIFVDEYQDINQVQETIINLIKRKDNLFMIGDVKQSIYAFRLSSPEIFIEKYNRFAVDTEVNKLINLNENFRSEENILEFSNMIFNALITQKTIGIDYKGTSQLVVGSKREFNQCVSMDIVDDESDVSEGQVIANKVGQLVKEGYNFKDIAILLRSKSDLVNEIYSELKKYNIPCEATYKTDLFKNNEILVIYHFLKLINNFNNDIALATTLKSFFVGLNDDELAEIRRFNQSDRYYKCVYDYIESGDNEHIKQKLTDLINLIKDLRFYLDSHTILDMVNKIFIDFDVKNYYLSFVDGLEKLSNIDELVRLISNEEYKYDLNKCLDYLDNIKKDGSVTLTLAGVGNSVKIMTIHSSKGLEYPAVIFGGIGKKFVLNKQTEDLIINDKLGVGVKQFNLVGHTQKESIVKNACKLNNKKNEIDEEVRLLYVALTRAKSRLCIVGKCGVKNLKYVASKNIYQSSNYFDLMIKAMPKESLCLFENKVDSFVVNEGAPNQVLVKFVDNIGDDSLDRADIVLGESDKSVMNLLGRYFDYHYPYQIDNNVALKNSVSQVLKEEQDYEKNVDNIALNSQLDDYSLRLGTAYHSVMQRLNYSENLADIERIIDVIKSSDLPYEDVSSVKILKAVNAIKTLLKTDSKILKEAQFVMKVNYGQLTKSTENIEVLIQGVIDLVIQTGNKAIIIDFKTNKTHNIDQLKDSYGLQLKMYAEAYQKAYNVIIDKMLLYSFELGEFIEIE